MQMNLTNLQSKNAEEILQWAIERYGKKVGLASSFGMEDMVLIDMIAKMEGEDIKDVTLEYAENFVDQMLEYGDEYSFLPY